MGVIGMSNVVLKLVLKVVLITALVLAAAFTVFSLHMAKTISFPKGLTLEGEKQWAVSNGMWGDLEKYTTQEYTVQGKDGYTLHCELVSNDKTSSSNKYVIISHGYTSNRYGAGKYVPIYIGLGYNCVIYDLRGHGENEKTVCTIGNYEAQDLIKLIDDTYERYGSDIYLGLHGESMGSSTSLSALGYDPKVHFVVADCGFTNLYELIGTGFKSNHLGFAEPAVDLTLRLRYGWSMKDTSAIDALEGNTVPICFIHGADDDFITPDNSERLKEKTEGYSELHIVDHAGHARSRAVLGKKAYADIVRPFLEAVEEAEKDQ